MQRSPAYAHLADWFEYLNDDCGYENWSQYLIEKLEKFPVKEGLDIGCGGGYFTRAFQKHGYLVAGLDNSPQMLDKAQRTGLQAGMRGEYLLGDIVKFRSPKKYDFATAINDCLNYIPKNKLASAIKSVHNALKKGGIFLFDVSSPRKFYEKIANTVSVDDREDITYLSFNTQETDGVRMDVSLFVKGADGKYERLEETHRQYIHTEEEIQNALIENGFEILEAEGCFKEDKQTSDRIVFLARKGGGR